jgi:hypothetical protein
MFLLLQQYKLVLVNLSNLQFQHFKTFNFYYETESLWNLTYVLDLRVFVFNKLPEDGTVVPKHVAAGT